jgi:hypothetical protein
MWVTMSPFQSTGKATVSRSVDDPSSGSTMYGPAGNAPAAERLAEVFPVPLEVHVAGDVEQAEHADGGVDGKRASGSPRRTAP